MAYRAQLSSSVFRRALRLFMPSFIVLLIMALAVHMRLSSDRYAFALDTLSSQLANWYRTCRDLLKASWSLNDPSYPQPIYNPALWTIPVEFTQSLLLFVVTIGLSRCLPNVRLSLLACIIAFCFWSGQAYTVEFLGGMFLAEITLLKDPSLITPASSPTILPKFMFEEEVASGEQKTTMKHIFLHTFWIANATCGLFIASWTNTHEDEVWGIKFLNAHTPEPYSGQRVWFCLSAFQIVVATSQLLFLQSIFTTSIAQYLGNISYSLYLTHNLCLTILEPRTVPVLNECFGNATLWGRQLTWAAGLFLYLPIIIYVADLFWRAVDVPTVKLARWLEVQCIVVPKKT